MSYNYTLKYRTFNQLLSDIQVDFQNLALENMIEPQQLIKVAKRVNYDLGLRIFKTKETLLNVEKGRVKLPDDFFVLNYALVCDEVSVTQAMPQGTWTEERPFVTPYKMTTPGVISTCDDGTVNCCNTCSLPVSACGCSAPISCNTPAVTACSCNTTPCGCNILLPLPDPCNSSSTIVNTTDTVSTTTRHCCWNEVLILQNMFLAIVINGSPISIPIGTPSQMQTSLNALGLGVWTVGTGILPSRYNFCVDGSATYGLLIVTSNNIPRNYTPGCNSDTVSITTNTSTQSCLCSPACEVVSETSTSSATATQSIQNCCWSASVPDGTTAITLVINGTTYSLPLGGGINGILDYLNGLNLGEWTLTIGALNTYTLCVVGTGNTIYGILSVIRPQATTTATPVCSTDTTTTTVNNVIITCKCQEVTPAPIPAPPVTCVTTTDPCIKPRVILNCKNECFEVVQIVNPGLTRTYKRMMPIKILENPQGVECGCPNLYMNAGVTGWIRDGWFYTDLVTATIYISYQGQLEDDNGDLLIPDHDMLNEYYEYAIKQRILENLMMNDEPVGQKLQLVEQRLRAARNNALSIVNTPNFAEMKRVWQMNRKAMYARYYDMFKSYPWYQWDRNPNNVMGEHITR